MPNLYQFFLLLENSKNLLKLWNTNLVSFNNKKTQILFISREYHYTPLIEYKQHATRAFHGPSKCWASLSLKVPTNVSEVQLEKSDPYVLCLHSHDCISYLQGQRYFSPLHTIINTLQSSLITFFTNTLKTWGVQWYTTPAAENGMTSDYTDI